MKKMKRNQKVNYQHKWIHKLIYIWRAKINMEFVDIKNKFGKEDWYFYTNNFNYVNLFLKIEYWKREKHAKWWETDQLMYLCTCNR